jgi:hypothetical protein
MLAYNNIGVRQQDSMFVPRRLDFLRLSFVHDLATLWDRGQGVGQLHGRSGGVASAHLLLGFFLRQGAFAFRGLAAGQSLSYSIPLGFGRGAGEEVVRPRDVESWRVAPVQLCVPLQKVFSLQRQNRVCFQQKVVEYSPVLEDFVRKTVLGHRGRRSRPTAPA